MPSRSDLTDNAVRDTLGTGIYFMTYESSKQLLTTFGGDGTHSNPLAVLVAGGLCGIVSWAMICEYPREKPPILRKASNELLQIQSIPQRAFTSVIV